MKKAIVVLLAILAISFAISFIASIIGLILIALFLGYANKDIAQPLKIKSTLFFKLMAVSMELGFLLSSYTHSRLFSEVNTYIFISISLLIGITAFLVGFYIKKHKILKKRFNRIGKEVNWRDLWKEKILI